MNAAVLPFITALLTSFITTPLTISFARRLNLVDNPLTRPHPAHLHRRVVPRGGGLPIFAAIFISSVFFLPLDKHLIGILLGGAILLITGLVDDRLRTFSPYYRVILQILAAGVVVASGVGISFIANPLGGVIRLDSIIIPFNFLGPHRIIPIADLLAFFWIVWMMNIINWSKGVDGQMPGIIIIAALTIALISWKLFSGGDPNQLRIAILALITAGASLGFLIFNWYPAKILPGFSGSTILGFMIAVLSILSEAKMAAAVLVLLIPAVDFIYIFLRRVLSHQSPFSGDRGHLHHKLLDLGWSHQKISLFYITSCAILGVLANLLSSGRTATVLGLGAAVFGGVLWLNLYLTQKFGPD